MFKKFNLFALLLGTLTTRGAIAEPTPEDIASEPLDKVVRAEVQAGSGLTAGEVARRSLVHSPNVQLKKTQLMRAAAEVDQALYGYLPSVTATARYTRLSKQPTSPAFNLVTAPGADAGPLPAGSALFNAPVSFATLSNQYALEANLAVPISDYFLRVAPANQAARASYESSRHDLKATERAALADAQAAYYTWLRGRLNLVVAQRALAQARAHLGDVKQAEAVQQLEQLLSLAEVE